MDLEAGCADVVAKVHRVMRPILKLEYIGVPEQKSMKPT